MSFQLQREFEVIRFCGFTTLFYISFLNVLIFLKPTTDHVQKWHITTGAWCIPQKLEPSIIFSVKNVYCTITKTKGSFRIKF